MAETPVDTISKKDVSPLDVLNPEKPAPVNIEETTSRIVENTIDPRKPRRNMLTDLWTIVSAAVDEAFKSSASSEMPPATDAPKLSTANPEVDGTPLINWMMQAFRDTELFFDKPLLTDDNLGDRSDSAPQNEATARIADQMISEHRGPVASVVEFPKPITPVVQRPTGKPASVTKPVTRRPASEVATPMPSRPTSDSSGEASSSRSTTRPPLEGVLLPSREDLTQGLSSIARILGLPVASLSNGFRGTAAEIQLQAVACARQMEYDPRILRTLLQFLLARSFSRLETERSGKPEDRVDAVVACLAAAGDRLTLTLDYRRLVAQLRKTLGEQDAKLRNDGFYLTWSVLADLLSRHDDRIGERHGVVYYHEVLCRQIDQLVRATEGTAPSNAMKERTRVGANNMAAYIGRILRDHDGLATEIRSEALKMRKKLSRLATACSISVLSYKPEQRIQAAIAVTQLCYGTESDAGRFPQSAVVAIDELMRNPMTGSGAQPEEYLQWAFNEAAAALSRLAIEERTEDASGSFFNSGVSLLRLSGAIKEGAAAPPDANVWSGYVRVLVNGLGLWWSLNKSNDWDDALTTRDGLDCAVNFFGAVVDSRIDEPAAEGQEPIIAEARELLQGIVQTLFACKVTYQGTTRFASDFTAWPRLFSSSRHLGIKTESGARLRPGSPAGLQRQVQEFLVQFLRLHSEVHSHDGISWPGSDPLLASAKLLHHAFRHLWEKQICQPDQSQDHWYSLPKHLIEQCEDLSKAAVNLIKTFSETYSDCYDPNIPDDAPGQKQGPLVACGLEDEVTWHSLTEFALGLTDDEGGSRLVEHPLSVELETNSYDWLPS